MSLIDLERALDALLPPQRPAGGPSAALIDAARAWSEAVFEAARTAGPLPLPADQIAAGRQLAQRPVFICGAHRSGTTLVRDLLDGHPSLVVLPSEGAMAGLPARADDVLHALAGEWLRRLANPINQPPYWLLGRTTAERSPYVDFARALMAWWALAETDLEIATTRPVVAVALAYASCTNSVTTSTRWVEKTPGNERLVHRLLREFPDAIVVHVVRDPIDVFTSRKQLEVQARGSFAARRIAGDLARSYRVAARHAEAPAGRHIVIRYEDMANAPERTMHDLAAVLGIEALPILLRPTVAGIPSSSNSSFAGDTAVGEIQRRPRAGGHLLTDVDLDVLAGVVGASARPFGYDVQPVRPWRAGVFRVLSQLVFPTGSR